MNDLKKAITMLATCKSAIIDGERFDFTMVENVETPQPEAQKILVPSEIGISQDVYGMNLHFGQNQMLCVAPHNESYSVFQDNRIPIQCELVKCERSDLKKGDVAFRTNNETPRYILRWGYCVIIDSDKYCFIDGNEDVIMSRVPHNNWYKVVPIQSTNK